MKGANGCVGGKTPSFAAQVSNFFQKANFPSLISPPILFGGEP
jgi:hypothetical protein